MFSSLISPHFDLISQPHGAVLRVCEDHRRSHRQTAVQIHYCLKQEDFFSWKSRMFVELKILIVVKDNNRIKSILNRHELTWCSWIFLIMFSFFLQIINCRLYSGLVRNKRIFAKNLTWYLPSRLMHSTKYCLMLGRAWSSRFSLKLFFNHSFDFLHFNWIISCSISSFCYSIKIDPKTDCLMKWLWWSNYIQKGEKADTKALGLLLSS